MNELLKWVEPPVDPDDAASREARRRWDSIAKPLRSLGLLEEAIVRVAALTGSADIDLAKRALVVWCADNGVVARGVAQTESSVTRAVALALSRGTSTVNPMARIAGCRVIPVDIGMLDGPSAPNLIDLRVMSGTADITTGPAMSRKQCFQAIQSGIDMARRLRDEGNRLICAGEMGIGNTTTASAVAGVLLDLPAKAVTGRGAGLSDSGLKRKIAAIETAISINHPNAADPVDVLASVGGLDIAALTGMFIGCARYRVPVVVDGFITSVAALCAARIMPSCEHAMIASHVSAEPAGALILNELGLSPLLSAGMRLGEGSGAVAILPLIDMACAVYASGQTFDKLGIEAYVPQEENPCSR